MSDCDHDCSSCGQNCAERKEKFDFTVPLNAASKVGRVIAVASGKGGVGKSFVATMLAISAARHGLSAAILDADITGPSIPKAFGLAGRTFQTAEGIEPQVTMSGIKVMSLNMLVENPTDPVVWRGPVIAGAVKQFWSDVHWGETDVMFVDMPPGTGDVPLTVYQSLPIDGVVVVTTAQELVEMIVEKSIKMAGMLSKKVLALVENMSYLKCPDCGKTINVFGESKVEAMARKFSIEAFARLPVESEYSKAIDLGKAENLEVPDIEALAAKIGL